jgi:hypothetical protein
VSEKVFSFAKIARLPPLPKDGVNPSTLWRWHNLGVRRRADGVRVHLQALKVGGRLLTSVEAVARFLEALNAAPGETAPQPRSPAARSRAAERAGEELLRLGA